MKTTIYSKKGRRTKQGDIFNKLISVGVSGDSAGIDDYTLTFGSDTSDAVIRLAFNIAEAKRIADHWLNEEFHKDILRERASSMTRLKS